MCVFGFLKNGQHDTSAKKVLQSNVGWPSIDYIKINLLNGRPNFEYPKDNIALQTVVEALENILVHQQEEQELKKIDDLYEIVSAEINKINESSPKVKDKDVYYESHPVKHIDTGVTNIFERFQPQLFASLVGERTFIRIGEGCHSGGATTAAGPTSSRHAN